jgi:hypothetical protein
MLNDVKALLRAMQEESFVNAHTVLSGEVSSEAIETVALKLKGMLVGNYFQYVRSYHGRFQGIQYTESAELKSFGWVSQAIMIGLKTPDQACVFTPRHSFSFLHYNRHCIASFWSAITSHHELKETFIVETSLLH